MLLSYNGTQNRNKSNSWCLNISWHWLNSLKTDIVTLLINGCLDFFSHCKESSRKVSITSALTVPTHSLVFTFLLYCVWRGPSHSETVDTETDGRTVPGSARSLQSRGNNSGLSMGLWQERSRLRASIPETFPLFPPSFLQIPHPLPHIPLRPQAPQLFSPIQHNFFPLFWEQEEQKSRLFVTGGGLLWSLG